VYSKQQLADMFGVKPRTIDYYRTVGVLPPPSPPRGCTAAYGAVHVERMRAIWGRDGMKDANLTLADLAERWNPQPEEAVL
jgi:DNA-binding transcriptional MerR regulator